MNADLIAARSDLIAARRRLRDVQLRVCDVDAIREALAEVEALRRLVCQLETDQPA